jgi:hypothetical protein
MLEVYCSRKIAVGFQGILDSRAKVGVGSVMLVGSREIVYRYVGIYISCSVDHHELFLLCNIPIRCYNNLIISYFINLLFMIN